MLIILFTIIFAFATFYLLKKHFRQLQLCSKFSGPPALPLIGSGLDLINKTPMGNLINQFKDFHQGFHEKVVHF